MSAFNLDLFLVLKLYIVPYFMLSAPISLGRLLEGIKLSLFASMRRQTAETGIVKLSSFTLGSLFLLVVPLSISHGRFLTIVFTQPHWCK
jgi:hypothetical protein